MKKVMIIINPTSGGETALDYKESLENKAKEYFDYVETKITQKAKDATQFAEKASKEKYDAVICLGAVIKGSTPHFDYVCAEVSKGIASVSLQTDKPVIFGVLTTNTIEQAIERAGTKAGNKGYDAAVTAIEMANLLNCF